MSLARQAGGDHGEALHSEESDADSTGRVSPAPSVLVLARLASPERLSSPGAAAITVSTPTGASTPTSRPTSIAADDEVEEWGEEQALQGEEGAQPRLSSRFAVVSVSSQNENKDDEEGEDVPSCDITAASARDRPGGGVPAGLAREGEGAWGFPASVASSGGGGSPSVSALGADRG